MKNGNKFIALEGIDGSGKTTVCKNLCKKLDAIFYRTPSFPFSSIRNIIDDNVNTKSRFFFYLSSVLHASFEINKLLALKSVVCDRYILSTLCYHRAVDPIFISFNESKIDILEPDFTFYLDASYEIRMKRISERDNFDLNKIIDYNLHNKSFQNKVVSEFRRYNNLIWIDANRSSADDVTDQIIKAINNSVL